MNDSKIIECAECGVIFDNTIDGRPEDHGWELCEADGDMALQELIGVYWLCNNCFNQYDI